MLHKTNCIDCSLWWFVLPKSFLLDAVGRVPSPMWSSHKFCRHTDLVQCNERAAGRKKIDYRVADNIVNVPCHDAPDVFANRLFLLFSFYRITFIAS